MNRVSASWCAAMLLASTVAASAQEVPPAEQTEVAVSVKDTDLTKVRDELSDLRSDLQKEMTALRAELQALTALTTAVKSAQERIDSLEDRIDDLKSTNQSLQTQVDALVKSAAALATRLENQRGGDTQTLLGNLNTDPEFRQQFIEATTPKAAVRFYNWDARPRRMNVNGTWYNLKPGPTTISVPYGPVAITHCDKQNPKVYTNWTDTDNGGFVMVFDVNSSTEAR